MKLPRLFKKKELMRDKHFGLGHIAPPRVKEIVATENILKDAEKYFNEGNRRIAVNMLNIAMEEIQMLKQRISKGSPPEELTPFMQSVNETFDLLKKPTLKQDTEGRIKCTVDGFYRNNENGIPYNKLKPFHTELEVQFKAEPMMFKGNAVLVMHPEDLKNLN